MLWLAVHMWALLLAAFTIGLGLGWWIWGQRQAMPPAAGDAQVRSIELGSLDLDGDAPSSTAGDPKAF